MKSSKPTSKTELLIVKARLAGLQIIEAERYTDIIKEYPRRHIRVFPRGWCTDQQEVLGIFFRPRSAAICLNLSPHNL